MKDCKILAKQACSPLSFCAVFILLVCMGCGSMTDQDKFARKMKDDCAMPSFRDQFPFICEFYNGVTDIGPNGLMHRTCHRQNFPENNSRLFSRFLRDPEGFLQNERRIMSALDQRDAFGFGMLHYMVDYTGHTDADLLTSALSSVSAAGHSLHITDACPYEAPIMVALYNNNLLTLQALAGAGANFCFRSESGYRPSDYVNPRVTHDLLYFAVTSRVEPTPEVRELVLEQARLQGCYR